MDMLGWWTKRGRIFQRRQWLGYVVRSLGARVFSLAHPSSLSYWLAAEPWIWPVLERIGAHHLVDPLEVTTPTFFLSLFALRMPAILHNILKTTHDDQ